MPFSFGITSDQAVTLQVQQRLKSVYGLIKEIESSRIQTEKSVDQIPEKSSDGNYNHHQRLKALYTAVTDTQHEVRTILKFIN